MTLDEISKVFNAFFKNPKQKVLFLKGPWGAGKSFFVRTYLEENANELPKYQYFVSLFGLSTLGEVRESINANLSIKQNNVGGKISKSAKKIAENSIALLGPNLGALGSSLFWRSVREEKSVIVFDDLERAVLPSHQVLGLASSLAENSPSKIIIIFNEEKLPEAERPKFSENREKIVDIEVLFNPTISDLVIQYLDEDKIQNEVIRILNAFKAPNIRLISKINIHLDQLKELQSSAKIRFDKVDLAHAAQVICLHYLAGFKITKDILPAMQFRSLTGTKDTKKPSPNELALEKIMSELNFQSHTFDGALLEILQNGFCSIESIALFKKDTEHSLKDKKFRQDTRKAFSLYGDNFQGTLKEVQNSLKKYMDRYSGSFEWEELIRNIKFIRELGYRGPMDKWIKKQLVKLNKLPSIHVRKSIVNQFPDCPSKKKYLLGLTQKFVAPDNPILLIERITNQRSWNPEDADRLNQMSQKDISRWIRNSRHPELLSLLRRILRMWSGHLDSQSEGMFTKKLHMELVKLAKSSKLNQIRIKNIFDIDFTEETNSTIN